MIIKPGMKIKIGKNGNREGTICAFVKLANKPNKVFLMSVYHVISGKHYPSKANIYSFDNVLLAQYQRTVPFKKTRGVDIALAEVVNGISYSNEINESEIVLTDITDPKLNSELSVFGAVSKKSTGKVINKGSKIIDGEIFSIQVKKARSEKMEEGDSGAPYYDQLSSSLVAMHLGRFTPSTIHYRTMWLSKIFDIYELELAWIYRS